MVEIIVLNRRGAKKVQKTVFYNYLGKIRAKITPFMVVGNR